MDQKIVWHPYPKERPTAEFSERHLVTCISPITGKPYVTATWNTVGGEFYTQHQVIAWSEMPAPYEPPEPEDMHPDAILARKYVEGDPETLKKLGLFD